MLYFTDSANSSGTSCYDSLDEMNLNVYYNACGKAQIRVENELLSLDEWKKHERNKHGYDADSICADPLFVNAENHDYRLCQNSPALKLGFKPIAANEIGRADYRF